MLIWPSALFVYAACLRGFTYSRGACLCFKPGPEVSWKHSKAVCNNYQSRLVKIDTSQKQAAMTYFVKTIGEIRISMSAMLFI